MLPMAGYGHALSPGFQVLGPLAVWADGRELKLGGPKQRLVLAILVAARGRSVSTGALIDGLWGDSVPATARKTLQGYVHHLRSTVGGSLATERGGYCLRVEDSQVDERRFSEMVEGSKPLIAVDPEQASGRLTDALGLWRGTVYADLDGEPVLRPEITRLSELRIVALGDRIDADLALGRHETLIGELESLTVEYPLRERLRAQHMLALYRSGRHGEALRVFARTRELFIEEMGLEPSDQLASLEDLILSRDASLDFTYDPTPGSVRAVRGYELRQVISTTAKGTLYRGYQRSMGREVTVRVVEAARANDPGFIARFEADTVRVAQIDSPHIAHIHDTWREPGRVYQVTQWIEGERLNDYLASQRPDRSTAVKLIGQIGDALAAAHRSGVVHGDVAPQAVVVRRSGDAYLTDFVVGGVARDEADDCRGFVAMAHEILLGAPPVFSTRGYEPLPPDHAPTGLTAVFERALDGSTRVEDFLRALRQVLGSDVVELAGPAATERTDLRNPFKGLQAFQVADAGDFFGRDDLIDRMQRTLTDRRLVAVVGPSGSGKSSAMKAGLAARLESGVHSTLVTEMFPGAHPFEELEAALRRVAVNQIPISDQLLSGRRGLAQVLKSILPGGTELVLLIDQFEELFSMVASEQTRSLFLDSLVAAVTDPRSRLRVVVALRADFFDRPLAYPEFGAIVEEGLVPVTMPDEAGIAAAIEGPAAAVGLQIESGLAAQIVRDVSDQTGGLPLLQYTLTELFARRSTDVLTLDTYHASGGVLGALAARAEQLYGALAAPGQNAIRQAFLRLVTVAEGAQYVRRRVTRAELATLEVDQAALNEALQQFGAHRLITFDSDPTSRAPTVEVAHEALLREWDRLGSWLRGQRDDLVLRRRLDAAIQEWEDSGRDATYLPTGGRLFQFDTWASGSDLALNDSERSFLEVSRERDADLNRRRALRRRRITGALAAAALIATAFGAYALTQRREAAQLAYDTETKRLGSEAAFIADSNYQVSLLMAVEAFRRDAGLEGLSALQRVLVEAGPYHGVLGAGDAYQDVHWVEGDTLVGATKTEVHVMSLGSGEIVRLPVEIDLTPPSATWIISAETRPPASGIRATSPAGIVAISDAAGALYLADVVNGGIRAFPAGDGSRAAAITDDGSLVAVGFPDGWLRLFDRSTGTELASVLANPPRDPGDITLDENVSLNLPAYDLEGVSWLRFDPAGQTIVSAGGVFLRAWHVADLTPAGPEIVNSWGTYDDFRYAQEPRYFWFDAEAPDVLVVAGDIFVTRWRLSDGERLSLATVPTGRNEPEQAGSIGGFAAAGAGRAVTLTSDGRVIALRLDELTSGGITREAPSGFVLDTQQNQTNAVAVDPDGTRFAVASGAGVVIGALDGSRLVASSVPIGLSVLPSLGRDGGMLAAGLVEEGMWDLGTDPPTRLAFDVELEVASFETAEGYFRFLPAAHADILFRASEFFATQEAFEFPSGRKLDLDLDSSVLPAWSDDGRLVAYAQSFTSSVVEDTATRQPVYSMSRMIRTADFDTAGSRLVMTFLVPRPASVSFAPSSGLVVDLNAGTEAALPDMPGGISGAAFTPDEQEIVAVGGEGDIWVLNAVTLEHVRNLQDADVATEHAAQAPVFTPDGEWMFSAADGVARVWHYESGRQLGQPFPSQPGGLPYAVVAGEILRVVTPFEGNALVWDVDVERWVDVACSAAGRNLTPAEWELFGPRDTAYRATCAEYAVGDLSVPEPDPVALAPPLPGVGTTVTVGRANWASGYFQAAVYAALLEELGYTVTDPADSEQSPSDAYVSMSRGAVDFWPNGWYPQHEAHHDKQLDDGTRVGENLVVIGQELIGAGLQGLMVTRSVADELGITSLAQINDDPAIAALFDVDGNGVGDIFGCPESWTCDDVIDEMIAQNDWSNLEQVKADYDELFDAAAERVSEGQPALQYSWSPSGYLARLIPGDNVRWLSLGAQEFALDGTTASGLKYSDASPARLGDECTADPCWLGWSIEDIRITANRDFAESNPAAVALFEVVKLNPEDIAAQSLRFGRGENGEEDVRRHAEEWIAQNRPLVEQWLAYALAAAS